MKRLFIILSICLFIVTGLAAAQPKLRGSVTAKKIISSQKSSLKSFTLDQLKQYNGANGASAYVAVDGIVYDVTAAWGGGNHHGVSAGTDATKAISRSPHGKSVLSGLPVVGKLSK